MTTLAARWLASAARLFLWYCVIYGVSIYGVAFAQDHPVAFGEIHGTVTSRWPGRIGRGYFPVFATLENRGTRTRTVEIRAMRDLRADTTTKSVQIKPGERVRVELLLPSFLSSENDALGVSGANHTIFLSTGTDGQSIGSVGPNESYSATARPVLILTERALAPGSETNYSKELSTSRINASPTDPFDNASVGSLLFSEMPRRAEAYSSLSMVMLFAEGGAPPAELLDPLLAWVRVGGSLAIVGKDSERLARATPGLREWTEPRFAIGGGQTYHCGLGRFLLSPIEIGVKEVGREREIQAMLRQDSAWVPAYGRPTPPELTPGAATRERIPETPFLFFLVLFVIAVGPVNFIWAKKRGTPMILILTIPAASLVVFVALIVAGILMQGIDTKCTSHSFTVLDQRTHRSSNVANRSVFAGFLAGAGFRPGAGAFLVPAISIEPDPRLRGFPRHRVEVIGDPFRCSQDDGILLSGEYLPPRRTVRHSILTDRSSRVRLSIERKGPELHVENSLGAPIVRLWIYDGNNKCHQMLPNSGSLEPGARKILLPSANPDVNAEYFTLMRVKATIPCTYAALLGANPFGDNCDVKATEIMGHHYVVGILDEQESAWK